MVPLIAIGADGSCGSFCKMEPVDFAMLSYGTRLVRNYDSSLDINSEIPSLEQQDKILASQEIR
jgi:hypothetical protein